jgi:predicted esterase
MSRARVLVLVLVLGACRDRAPAVAPRDAGPTVTPRASPARSSIAAPDRPPVDASTTLPSPAVASAPAKLLLPHVETDWCIDGLVALDEETCCVLPPPEHGRPRDLLVYLHGITPPTRESPQKTTVQTAVLHASVRAGAAALVPRGRRGIGPGDAKDWWAWPTSPDTHERLAPSIVAKIAAQKKALEAAIGAPFERTFLAGSSNGAYFLVALALRGDLDRLGLHADGIGAMSGGAAGGRGADSLSRVPAIPTYVGYGTYDEETKKNARALLSLLEAARWPLRAAEHPFGHGAKEAYLDEAFAFWRSATVSR